MKKLIHCVLLLVLSLSANATVSEWQFEGVSKVVAMADIHGAYEPMVSTLTNAGVIDDARSWMADSAHLVIVGDILDRGPQSREAMDLLMRLEGEAEAAGGRVHVLAGNHEAMNLTGDLRYVSREEFAAFAGEETAEERERWRAAWMAKRAPSGRSDEELVSRFDNAYPPGFFAHRRAFSATGRYGKWLLQKPIVVVINGTAFVHGGLSPVVGDIGLDGVNKDLHGDMVEYVQAVDRLQQDGVLLPTDPDSRHIDLLSAWLPTPETVPETIAAAEALKRTADSDLHAIDGPLWYRGNVYCCQLIERDQLDNTLAAIGATRVVIGHTPTKGRRVYERFAGRVIEIDTGILNNYYDGRGHALILEGDSVAVVSEESVERLVPAPHPRRVGDRPDTLSDVTAVESLLQSGEIQSIRNDDFRRRIVTVSDGESTVEALFVKRPSRGFYPDVAAYRLDRLLGLDQVPVAVVREVDGSDGSLQFLPTGWMDEQGRSASGRGGGASCPLDRQWTAMYVFDVLIYNEGRSLAQMLYSPDTWQLVLVGHKNAFSTRKGRPRHLEQVPLTVGDAWKEALAALDDLEVEEAMGDVLDKRRRRALIARRDELLATN